MHESFLSKAINFEKKSNHKAKVYIKALFNLTKKIKISLVSIAPIEESVGTGYSENFEGLRYWVERDINLNSVRIPMNHIFDRTDFFRGKIESFSQRIGKN